MKESGKTYQIISQIKDNSKSVASGGINPAYQGLPELRPDHTSPITISSTSEMAEAVAGKVANVVESSKSVPSTQSRSDIEKLAIDAASKLGVTLDKVYIEDLMIISYTESGALTAKDAYMYLRGVAKANQVSATSALTGLISSVETILNKNRQVMQDNIDSNKLISEKLTLMGTKIDNITPIINSKISSEHAAIRKLIRENNEPKVRTRPESSNTQASAQDTPSSPEKEDILTMAKVMKMREDLAQQMSDRYLGIISWAEYQTVMTGGVSPEKFKEMIKAWKEVADRKG